MSIQLIDESEIISRSFNKIPILENQSSKIEIGDDTKRIIKEKIKNISYDKILKAHRMGYACVNTSIGVSTNKTCRLDNCSDFRLRELISSNLDGMKRIIEWNIKNDIMLYRISSVVIPFASHEINTVPWWDEFKNDITDIGKIIKISGIRVSMHPGQYVNINSPDRNIVDFSIRELEYHARFMDLLEIDSNHRMILHIGGGYGDKKASIKRFIDIFDTLSDNIKSRLTIENDDKTYNIWDILDVSSKTGLPVIFDVLHHQVNHNGQEKDKEIKSIMEQCFSTWSKKTGIPKIHFSTQKQDAKYGVHADSVDINVLMRIYFELIDNNFDIMLETKDKEMSVLRAMKVLQDIKNW